MELYFEYLLSKKLSKQGSQHIRQELSTFRSPICSKELHLEGLTPQTRIYFSQKLNKNPTFRPSSENSKSMNPLCQMFSSVELKENACSRSGRASSRLNVV